MSEAELEIVRMVAQAFAQQRPVRLTYRPEEAADALGVSEDFFRAHVRPELKWIRKGRLTLVPVAELEKWVLENAERTLRGEI